MLTAKGRRGRRVPVKEEVLRRFEKEGRFAHFEVECGDGREVLQVLGIYGFKNAWRQPSVREKNEDLIKAALEYGAELGKGAVVITGDFNTPPELSTELMKVVSTAKWIDIQEWAAHEKGEEPIGTHFADNAEERRLDLMYLNEEAQALCDSAWVTEEDHGLPDHRPLHVALRLGRLGQRVTVRQKPIPLPLKPKPGWKDSDGPKLWEEIFQERKREWEEAKGAADVDRLWKFWSEMAEQFLLRRAGFDRPWQRGH